MIEINAWINEFLKKAEETFGGRVFFIGLQGSYARGEAVDTSDIDVVLILDELSSDDIAKYNGMLGKLPHRELVCGFLSGKSEIFNWDKADLFQFYYDTKPIKGSLQELQLLIDKRDVKRAIKMGVCNIYHGCIHNMLYEKSEDILKALYKSASFVVQAICFCETGEYISRQKDLLNVVSPEEKVVLETFMNLKSGGEVDFSEMSETLFNWAKSWIEKTK